MWISVKKEIIKKVTYSIYQKMLYLFDKYKSHDDANSRILAIHCERLVLHFNKKINK